MKNRSKILLIYTGGTIGMIKDYKTGVLRAFDFDKLLMRIPELSHLDCEIDTYAFEDPLDSSNMDPDHWVRIASLVEEHYKQYDGFVVLHGSDTMSYSASVLSFMLENLAKPVILTGSQLPIGDLRTDAKENLITAIEIASLKKNGRSVIREVCLYFEYKLYRGNRTTKINAEHFEAFASMNFPPLAESGVHLKVNHQYLLPTSKKPLKVHKELDNRIAVIKLFPGITRSVIAALMLHAEVRAVILETYGAGNAPTSTWFTELIEEAIAQGKHVVNVTQCSGGSVMMGHYETSSHLKRLKVINGKDITTEAAVAKLMYLLGQGVGPKVFKTIFETSLRGEMV
ncbi:asparaginase [Robertkochia sediminum]|uniref:asparaginase n=1 Tax=Robertkochia sediminum TaxID=2785326 RepID=UPI0019322D35|nr:asparaginase [Robertkochia sediminum]MBL7473887.1 asparaginase [Robertkochia sediminum]